MIVLWGPDLIQIYNDSYRNLMGIKHPVGLGQPTRLCWPEVWHINGPIYERVWGGETVTVEDGLYPLARHGVLEDVWFNLSYSPLWGSGESVDGVLVTLFETTAQHNAELALRKSDERFRLAMQAVDGMIFDWDVPSGRVNRSDGLLRVLGHEPASVDPTTAWWAAQMHPDDLARRVSPGGKALLGEGDRFIVQVRMRHGAGHWVDVQDTGIILRDEHGQPVRVVGSSIDVTARNRAEAALRESEGHLQVLVAELQHRTRNLVAVVRGIARKSMQPSPEMDEFEARLSALSRVQGFLARSSAYTVPLRDLVHAELRAMGSHASARITVKGAPVVLPGEGAQILALALHELATNAAKYGALADANPKGRLSVCWAIREREEEASLLLQWLEHGVTMPPDLSGRRGYGTELITRALPYQLNADTRLDFGPDGIRCEVRLPSKAFDAVADGATQYALPPALE